ncbi:MAG: sugar O-acetyltransferase [Bacteroidetes bacterium]|nr:sugar O-acetyltransferase [Bacteroidota bacterium]
MENLPQDIFTRMRKGGLIRFDDPEYPRIFEAVSETLIKLASLNSATSIQEIRAKLGEITGQTIPDTTTVFAPFYTNFGRHISLGHHVFINHGCSFLDLGGITIGDDVLIAPMVSISSESHPVEPSMRKMLVLKPVVIQNKVWIGARATILPGVTVGANSVVAAGAVVTQDVPSNVVVGGVPAKIIKHLDDSSARDIWMPEVHQT